MLEPDNQSQSPTRPQMLTILCVLSYIWGGFMVMAFLMIYLSYHEILPILLESDQLMPGMDLILNAGRNFFLTGFILNFLSLIGVSLMWRLRKAGLHFYTGAQIMIALMPVFYLEGNPIPYLEWMVTIGFIVLYARFYRLFS